jgi:hypothetical protein
MTRHLPQIPVAKCNLKAGRLGIIGQSTLEQIETSNPGISEIRNLKMSIYKINALEYIPEACISRELLDNGSTGC